SRDPEERRNEDQHRSDDSLEVYQRLRAGDERAFDEVLSRHYSRIYGYVSSFLNGCPGDVTPDDLAQEAFIQLWQRRSTIPATVGIPQALFQMARSVALTYLAKLTRRTKAMDQYQRLLQSIVSPQPNEIIDRAHSLDVVRQAMNQLTPRQYEVFYMRYVLFM